MDNWWIVMIIAIVVWSAVSLLVGILLGKMMAKKDQQVVQRRPIAPREDGQRVTRNPEERPAHRARVTTAHMSQPRSQWNSNSKES